MDKILDLPLKKELHELIGPTKEDIAMLYENESRELLNEAAAADNSGSFETVVFPIIRRVFSKLPANDLANAHLIEEFPTTFPTHEWAEVIGNIHDNPELLESDTN